MPTAIVARSSATSNPYSILGVGSDATDEDIKRNYRKLCLKYHPDKNVGKPKRVQEANEEKFKEVQQAYDDIETAEKRRNYEFRRRDVSSYPFASAAAGARRSSTGSSAAAEAYFRSFYGQNGGSPGTASGGRRSFYTRRRTPFYVNGIDISALFGQESRPGFWNPGGSIKSVFVQRVWLDLETLYKGNEDIELRYEDSWWKRLRAAFRGGVWLPILYQSLVMMAPLSRMIGIRLSLLVGLGTFWATLPSLPEFEDDFTLSPGFKGGTKLSFANVEQGVDVVFILEERPHVRFTRVGNDLLTTVEIYESEAKRGCAKTLDPLGKNESPIIVELQANQIRQSGQQVTVKGRGWPMRKRGGRKGDLIVTVQILPDKKQHKGRRTRRN